MYQTFELGQLQQMTANAVIGCCRGIFASHGIPQKLMSNNGLPFNEYQFVEFMQELEVVHVTSSLHYPQSNRMAEQAVREAKKVAVQDNVGSLEYYHSLVEWKNMPRDQQLQPPVQRLMGRGRRMLLPTHSGLLQPRQHHQKW